MTTYAHLDPSILPSMQLPDGERAFRMLADRFIAHQRLAAILDYVEFLRFYPAHSRACGLVVSGPPGSGKTMIAKHTLRRFPFVPAEGTVGASRPVLAISMTGAREAKVLYNRLLAQLGVPDAGNYAGPDRERMALKLCRAAGVRLLVVDEMQDILTSTPRQQRIALDTIKFLMNELSLPILALGTSQAPDAMKVDEHLNARFIYRVLPVWTADQYLVNFLDTLERVLPLKKASHLSSLPNMTTLIRLSEGVLDQMVRLVSYAAAHAVEEGSEQVTAKELERAAMQPPIVAVRQMLAVSAKAA